MKFAKNLVLTAALVVAGMIVVGGVIPEQDFDDLYASGADAIYPPGTVIPVAARELLDRLRAQVETGGPS